LLNDLDIGAILTMSEEETAVARAQGSFGDIE